MGKPAFVKFEQTKDLADKVYEALELARNSGKMRRGVNETTKAIERGHAKLVVMAEDVTPEEILMHLPILCQEKQVPFAYVPSKLELGKASGIEVPTSSVAVTEEGEAKKHISDLSSKIKALLK
ncbi:MAG: 50S ribosomal protein L7ae [Candidatus Aenigmarchaeota archaeon]|nr:50S ribosomal protein L7ae [Candidatus Aenigmarchaeota archaeon]